MSAEPELPLVEQARQAAFEATRHRDGHYMLSRDEAQVIADAATRTLLTGLKGEALLLSVFSKDEGEGNRAAQHVLSEFQCRCDELLADLDTAEALADPHAREALPGSSGPELHPDRGRRERP